MLHGPQLARTRCARTGELQGAASKALVELVHGGHQAHAVFGHGLVKVQRQLVAGGGLQVHEHHARFGVLEAGAVDAFHDGVGRLCDVGAVAGGAGQGDACAAAVLRVLFPERTGADERHDLARVAALLAQLFCSAASEFGDGFLQLDQLSHCMAEAAGAGDLLFGRWLVFKFNAGHAVEFAHGFFQHHRPACFRCGRAHALQVQCGVHAVLSKLCADLAAHAPHVAHFGGGQQGLEFFRCARAQVADLRVLNRVAAGFAFGAFGDGVGQLGKGLGGTDADAGRDADPLVDAPADLAGTQHQVTGDATQVNETFIDGIDLLHVTQACGQRHHAVTHVTVKREIGRQGDQARVALQVAQLKVGRAHLDAQRFGFVAAGNGAAVVVSE